MITIVHVLSRWHLIDVHVLNAALRAACILVVLLDGAIHVRHV